MREFSFFLRESKKIIAKKKGLLYIIVNTINPQEVMVVLLGGELL